MSRDPFSVIVDCDWTGPVVTCEALAAGLQVRNAILDAVQQANMDMADRIFEAVWPIVAEKLRRSGAGPND